jgi:replicative DNA helicase
MNANNDTKQVPWVRLSEVHKNALLYVDNRRTGRIKSLKTPWSKVDEVGVGGFDWNTIITVAGRPGSGKTTIVNQFTREAHKRNPNQDFAVLDFQFEMTHSATGIREFTQATGVSYRKILSADRPLDDYTMNKINEYIRFNQNRDIFQVDIACTVAQMKMIIREFYAANNNKPIIVTIDHSVLIKTAGTEKDKFETLYNLGEMMTELKKELRVMFIVLTQMNRSIEDQIRRVPGTAANFPTSADIYGADALLQHSDIMMVIARPATMNLPVYGPQKFVISKNTLIMHFLKVRNGEPTMVFFREDFANQKIWETDAPDANTNSLPPQGSPVVPANFVKIQ